MSGFSVFIRSKATSEQAREELRQRLAGLAQMSQDTEPGVLRYTYATAYDPEDEYDYLIEEYADQQAADDHMKTPEATALVEWIGTGALGAVPESQRMVPLDPAIENFVRPAMASPQADLALVYTEVVYQPGQAAAVLEDWKAVGEVSAGESGTLLWGIWKDPEQPDKAFVVHAYESMDYLVKVHVPMAPLVKMRSYGDRYIKEMKVIKLKVQGGFLYKEAK